LKTLLSRVIKFIVIFEVVYLVLINAALNLPLTQTIVNKIKPDKFTVSWSRAWSLYPFRVHAQTIFANGQSRSQQWQVEVPAASASISLISLLWHSVKLNDIEGEDIIYHQRPRPKPDKDYSDVRTYFPPIKGRVLETKAVVLPPLKQGKKPWNIDIKGIHARGEHEIWLLQFQGKIAGEVRTDLTFQTRGGPFSLNKGEVDVDILSLIINGDHEVSKEGHIQGTVEFLPFVPKENKGLKSLSFLNIEVDVRAETESLAYLNFYLTNFDGIKVDGSGFVQGHLNLQQGQLEDPSDIKVSARELALNVMGERLEGEGSINIKTSGVGEETEAVITFTNLQAFDVASDVLLFTGEGVTVEAQGNRSILPVNDKHFIAKRLAFTIPEMEVPDLGAYQIFLPDQWPFKLHGGKGKLQGYAETTQTGFNCDLRLSSEAADVGIKEYRFNSNLDMLLKLDSPAITSGIDIAGSYAHLQGATLSNSAQQKSKPWQAGVDITQGKLSLQLPQAMDSEVTYRELYQALKGKKIASLLNSDGEEIKVVGFISDLSWVNVLLKNRLGFSLTGSGEVTANILLNEGWLGTGSKLVLQPENFGVGVLDYRAEGNGKASLLVERGGEHPDLNLTVALEQGEMRRKDETQAFIENVDINLQALVGNMTLDDKDMDMDLHLQIPRAKIRDMSVYNLYLPQNSPMQFTGGKAKLSADIKMTPETAKGYVKLRTTDISATIDQQQAAGELTADITLIDGVPENMDFDISGSSVTLDNVTVAGAEANIDDEKWSARFELKKARAIWKRPVDVQIEADLQMTDSKPIVAVIANQRGKNSWWLDKALTIDDVNGNVVMNMAQSRITVPYAFASSDKIDIGAKGVITADDRDGVLYVRFRKLHGILKINNGERNLDVLNAREKFDQYDSDAVLSRISAGESSGAAK
jgi:hypothetical protein